MKKNCNICQKQIKEGEEYCNLTQYGKDWKFYKDSDYHLTCWIEKFMGDKKLKEDTKYFMHEAFETLRALKAKVE
jgi:hypothetical protein